MESLEALRRLRGTAEKAARRAAFWAPLLAAFLGGAPSARAASSARLNIDIDIQMIAPIIDLTAVPGASSGTIALSWTEPYHSVGAAPYAYDVRASSVAQIVDDVAFSTNAPLSAFSPSVPPAPGAGGGAAGFVITGLTPDVTYYFAIREKDSTTFRGAWSRTVAPARNASNFAPASAVHPAPAGGAVAAVGVSSLTATWSTVAGATDYVLVASTSAAGPPAVSASSTTASSTATLAGLGPNTTYFLFVAACQGGCSGYAPIGSTITLAAPAVGLSTASVSSATVSLAWSPNGNPAGTSYAVRQSTDGVAFATVATVSVPGASLAGLNGGATYYFEVVALSGSGVPAPPSNILTVLTPIGPTPSTPTGLLARGALLSASLTWDPLPPLQQGAGLSSYALLRSTNAGFGFVQVTTTTGVSFLDRPLPAAATFYYKLVARAVDGAASAPSAAVSASPFTLAPMEPIGVGVAASSAAVTLSWSPVKRFLDGQPFVSAGAPTVDELGGYSVYRSTDICNPSYVLVSSLPVTTTSLTDATGGQNYYYHLLSFNTAGASQVGPTVSSLGERNFFTDDCKSTLVLDDAAAATLISAGGGAGGTGAADVRVVSSRRPQDVGNGVYQSVQWRAYQDGGSEVKGYTLPKPARIVLHFNLAAGSPAVDTAPVAGFAPAAAPAGAVAASPADLGAYWYNGAQWVKMYGKVDTLAQTVTVQSPNLGVYQVRAQARSAGAVFDVSNLASRVITPNGDGRNDTLIFSYDPGPKNVVPTGKVFDLQGAFVADMTPGLVPNTLTWDGRMNGAPVHGGVYVYRITGDGKTFTGSVVVAR